jgi:hypothetical protein
MNPMTETTTAGQPLTPQEVERNHADLHERASKHHREAARLYERGDWRQADIHASIARGHAVAAMELD